MRLLLPHLETTTAAELLAALRGTGPSPEARLTAGLTYSMAHLAEDDQDLLTVVCLMDGVVSAAGLGALFAFPIAPHRFQGVDAARWAAAFDRAAHVGLLTALDGGWYRIHPALPAHLATRWDPAGRATTERALAVAYGVFAVLLGEQIKTGQAPAAYQRIGAEYRMLTWALGYTVEHGLWPETGSLLVTLSAYWDLRGPAGESREWDERIRNAVETEAGCPPPLDGPAGGLWLTVVSGQADDRLEAHDLDAAESECLLARNAIVGQSAGRLDLAGFVRRLGSVAGLRERWNEAERRYCEALAVAEELDLKEEVAGAYSDLGDVAKVRGQWPEAEDWYRKSLALRRELGDRRKEALTSTALGNLALVRRRAPEAQDHFRQAFVISEELGDETGVARAAHQLGATAEQGGQLDAAEHWYRISLGMIDKLGDPMDKAASYIQLGRLAMLRGRLDEAAQWFHRNLAIVSELDHRQLMAVGYQLLGSVDLHRKRHDEAESWLRQSIATFTAIGEEQGVAGSHQMLGQVLQAGRRWAEAEQSYRTSLELSEALGDQPMIGFSRCLLGYVAGARGDLAGALSWTIHGLAVIDEGYPARRGLVLEQLAPLARRLGVDVVEREWRTITGTALPGSIRELVDSFMEGNQ